VYASLARLQLDYVDLLYFHGFDPVTPVEESLAAIEDLANRDVVRYFAVSNYTVDQLKLYRAAERNASIRCRILAVQNQFNILDGESQRHQGALEFAARTGISFVAWSPLARGLLTDRYLDRSAVGAGDRLYDEGTLDRDTGEAVMDKLRGLAHLAGEWDLTLSQLALAYTLSLPGMGPVIPAVSTVEQLEMNAEAGQVHLSDEQKSQVREVLQT
jgi:aryl-alcohol dehydrogenase-like predicted oxidoreductase